MGLQVEGYIEKRQASLSRELGAEPTGSHDGEKLSTRAQLNPGNPSRIPGAENATTVSNSRGVKLRGQLGAESFLTPADQWRKQRTLKEIDRDVASGLDQLLLTPNSRRRAGIETEDAPRGELSTVDLLLALKHGDITREEYDL
jgi:hypothetical protein